MGNEIDENSEACKLFDQEMRKAGVKEKYGYQKGADLRRERVREVKMITTMMQKQLTQVIPMFNYFCLL